MKVKAFLLAGLLGVGSTLFAGVHGEWGYSGDADPSHWGDLRPEFFMCKDGKNQSPINIDRSDVVLATGLKPIEFHYTTGASEAVNNGHTVKVSVKDGSYITVDGIRFKLLQFHFHSPSENQVDGKNYPLEAHFVHKSDDGQLAVVAVMYDKGAQNTVLKKICSTIFTNIHQVHPCRLTPKDINALLPQNKEYYRFSGSLTTPPCSEGVRWLVMKEHLSISPKQVESFVHVMMKGHNNRPVQPLNARKVMKNR